MRYQRQVDRAFNPVWPFNHATRQDAIRQIKSAWVLHVDAARNSLKHDAKRIIQLRCSTCGHRHLYHDFHRGWADGSLEHCCYGWWFGVRFIFKKAYFHLLHGEDLG